MKKIILLLIFSTLFLSAFSDDIKDYKSFATGKVLFLEKDYEEAKIQFEFLVRNYPSSLVLRNRYAYYYIGMNYYYLGDYEKALFYLDQAIYIPNEFKKGGYFATKKSHFFEYERNYYLAQIYFKLNDKEEGIKHLKFLIKDYYSHSLDEYESKALRELGLEDQYYEVLYKVKYENDLSLMKSLNKEDIRMLADYFLSKGLFDSATVAYQLLLEEKQDRDLQVKLLETLTRNKKYDEVINYATVYLDNEVWGDYYYYRANALRRRGQIDFAISDFRRVENGKFVNLSKYETGRLYYIKKSYNTAIAVLKPLTDRRSHTLLLDTYLALDKNIEFSELAIEYIEKYPYSDEAAYYRFLLYKLSNNENYLTWIKKYNFNTYYYEMALAINSTTFQLEEYPLSEGEYKYKEKIDYLDTLSKLGDSEILKMNFENLNLPEEDKAFEGYIISKVYESGDFYHQAIKNSKNYARYFSEYTNFIENLYPRYYRSTVEAASMKYGVEADLIYAVILKESMFSDDIVSKAGAYGLMQMILPTAKDMKKDVTPEQLMTPAINIDLGTRYLSILLKKYKGDIAKVAAAYNGGMGNVDKWSLGGELIIEDIPFPETKAYTKDVISNYYKYKRLYN